MAFNLKRTKNMTLGCLLINGILLALILNNRHIKLSNALIQSRIKGHLASHNFNASLSSNSWLPKISFIVIQGNHDLTSSTSQFSWNSSGPWYTGFVFSKSLIHCDEDAGELMIPYVIMPGSSFRFSISYDEITNQSLQLPQIYLEEGETDHKQLYTIDIDSRFKEVKIPTNPPQSKTSEGFTTFKLEVETHRESLGLKLQWKYTQILNSIQFMG